MASSSASFAGYGGSALRLLAVLALLSATCRVEGSNLVNILKGEGQFSIFYQALLQSEELASVEGRTVLNGSSYVVFAPTDNSFRADFEPKVLTCLQQSASQKGLIVKLLNYLQITTLHTPVVNAVDLAKFAVDGRLWTVLGTPILVQQTGPASVTLFSESKAMDTVVNSVRPVDTNVTLVTLDAGLVVDDSLSEEIVVACMGGGSIPAPGVPAIPRPSIAPPRQTPTTTTVPPAAPSSSSPPRALLAGNRRLL
ncbi:hypothetical protein CBR_g3814 [Chara braunii]|uniref:FAS1 domain-containing protein n=1 Tax=Chara braunii TaxID=69332 RepID=A0A388KGG3_CHABU|nr:hypothetical protein CBR_g3814 [Chara braunii]|eukprot:GBG69116.1 hypothetical protein CBR_g3814 [Chara braunii]